MTSERRKIKIPVEILWDVRLKDYLSDDLKLDPNAPRQIPSSFWQKQVTYARNKRTKKISIKKTVICSKCRYPFTVLGFPMHRKACDGTGPKATDFRIKDVFRIECQYCDLNFRWTDKGVTRHEHVCALNPKNIERRLKIEERKKAKEYIKANLLSHKTNGDFYKWVTSAKKGIIYTPRFPEVLIRIERYLQRRNFSEEDIKEVLDDLKLRMEKQKGET